MPDVVDISPDRFAAFIAPVIERLTLAVLSKTMARGACAAVPTAVPPGAMRMFGQLRTALLARKVPTAALAAIYRYRDAGDVRRDLEGLHAAGLIDTTDNVPSRPPGAAESSWPRCTKSAPAWRASRGPGRKAAWLA